MAERKPLIVTNGQILELPAGDFVFTGETITETVGDLEYYITQTSGTLILLVDVNLGKADFSLYLPSAANDLGLKLIIVRVDSTAYLFTIISVADTINGVAEISLTNQYESVTLVSNRFDAWFVT